MHMVAGFFAVVTVDAFVFGNVSTTTGIEALVAVNYSEQNLCQSIAGIDACSMHESCIHGLKGGFKCTESGKKKLNSSAFRLITVFAQI